MERAKKCQIQIKDRENQEATVLEHEKNAFILVSLIHPVSGSSNTIKLRWDAAHKTYSGKLGAFSIETHGPNYRRNE